MRVALSLLVFAFLGAVAQAAEPDSLALLKRDFGKSIQVILVREIRYCPDNTCEIYRIKDPKKSVHFPGFVYLHLFHQSDYIYLKESAGGLRPFRQIEKDTEPLVRKSVEIFCRDTAKTPTCILAGLKSVLGVLVTVGRYDEGKFIES